MGLRTWWLEGKLARAERKLHHLRGLQKIAREKRDDARLDRLTHEINGLVARVESVRTALKGAT